MITSKCYSENRFEMAFKIRHTKLWTNAIKMHIHFYNVQHCRTLTHSLCLHESNIGTPLTHHKTNKPRDSNSKLNCLPASMRTHIKYSHNTHILLNRKELLFAAIFSSFRYIERMWKKSLCECLYFVVLFNLWLMMISLVSFAYKLIHSSSQITQNERKKFTINQSIKFTTRN